MVSIPHSPIATRGHSSGHTDGIVTEDLPSWTLRGSGVAVSESNGASPMKPLGRQCIKNIQNSNATVFRYLLIKMSLIVFLCRFFCLILKFFVSFEKCSVNIASMRVIQSHFRDIFPTHPRLAPSSWTSPWVPSKGYKCCRDLSEAYRFSLENPDSDKCGGAWRWCACGVKWK